MALAFFGLLGLYLVLVATLTTLAWRAAKRRGVAGWKWGLPTLIVLYLLVFWDHVPTLLLHEYECRTRGGIEIFMSPEDLANKSASFTTPGWRISSKEASELRDGPAVDQREARIASVKHVWTVSNLVPVIGISVSLLDRSDEAMLARFTYFLAGHRITQDQLTQATWKLWLHRGSCDSDLAPIMRLRREYIVAIGGKHGN